MIKTFPTKPHLKKFVLWMLELPEPLKINERDMLGRNIIKVLQEKRSDKNDLVKRSATSGRELLTSRLSVVLTTAMERRSPSLHRIINVNYELDNEFQEALITWIRAQQELEIPTSTACKNFLARLKIDEKEYTYDAAYKVWQRHNQSVVKKTIQEAS